jgi:hypothetical protein
MMNRNNGKRISPDDRDEPIQQRRIGQVVHDERGSASVRWYDAPDDYERTKLEIANTGVHKKLELKRDEDTFNPYDRKPVSGDPSAPKGGKRDLKKLSEWLKLMRAMEDRKKGGED